MSEAFPDRFLNTILDLLNSAANHSYTSPEYPGLTSNPDGQKIAWYALTFSFSFIFGLDRNIRVYFNGKRRDFYYRTRSTGLPV